MSKYSWMLALSLEPNAIANNKRILDTEKERMAAEKKLLDSMEMANISMCTHANKQQSSSCMTCFSCGFTW